MNASIGAQRALIWISLVLIVIYTVGYVMLGFYPPPEPSLDPEQVRALYADNNMQARVGVVLCLFSGAFLLPWSAVVSIQMARLEKGLPIWAIVQFGMAIIGTIFLWGPPLFWGAAAYSVDRDPALTLLLHQVGWLMFITPLCAFPMQLVSIGVVSLQQQEYDKSSPFPRWIGYLTLWQAVQSLGGLAAMLFKKGIFAWNGLFPFYIPVILFGVWTIALAYTLFRAFRHQEMANI